MAAPYSNLRSKLNRAIAAYLVSVGGSVGAIDDIVPANSRKAGGYPNTTVRSTLSKPEIQMTGIRRISVHISIKGSATQAVSDSNAETARGAFDARVAATGDSLMLSNDSQTLRATAALITAAGRALAVSDPANHADMADFTLQEWYDMGDGDGEADDEGCAWEEILLFDAVCCAANVD